MTALSRTVALLLVTVLAAGCGDLLGPPAEGSARARAAAIVDEVRQAVEEAKERAEERTGAVERGTAPQGRPIRPDTRTAFDDERYTETLEQGLRLARGVLGRGAAATFGVEFTASSRYVHDRPEEGPVPATCRARRSPTLGRTARASSARAPSPTATGTAPAPARPPPPGTGWSPRAGDAQVSGVWRRRRVPVTGGGPHTGRIAG